MFLNGLREKSRAPCASTSTANWAQVQAIYRRWLYDERKVVLDDDGQVIRRGFAAETAEMVIN